MEVAQQAFIRPCPICPYPEHRDTHDEEAGSNTCAEYVHRDYPSLGRQVPSVVRTLAGPPGIKAGASSLPPLVVNNVADDAPQDTDGVLVVLLLNRRLLGGNVLSALIRGA